MAVVALARPKLPADSGARDFVAAVDRAAARYGDAWRPCRIVRDGRLFLVDDTAQSVGAFKIRGATVAVAELAASTTHVCAASSGSFGMSVAAAAGARGLPTTVFMPATTPEDKQEAIRRLGACVDARWPTYEAAKQEAQRFAGESPGYRFLDGVGPEIFWGNGSLAREIAASGQLGRSRAAVVVPLGIGSLAVPTALYLEGAGFGCDLVVVEPLTHAKFVAAVEGAPWPLGGSTLADGAAVFELPERSGAILGRVTKAAIAVSEEEIADAMRYLWREHQIRAEGAGALAVAAYRCCTSIFAGYKQVWACITGRNIDDDLFWEVTG